MSIRKNDSFQGVYPFATEMVSSYFSLLNLNDKTVFTVGSSLDQAFNALVLGAKDVTVFDINPKTEDFFKRKKEIILTSSMDEVYNKVLNMNDINFSTDVFLEKHVIKMNNYLQSSFQYNKLQERLLQDNSIKFIIGDLFHLEDILEKQHYDRMIFSNVLQYLDMNLPKDNNPYKFLSEKMDVWTSFLSEDGILQLLYLYSYSKENLGNNKHSLSTYNMYNVINSLDKYLLEIDWFSNCFESSEDAIVTYRKRK